MVSFLMVSKFKVNKKLNKFLEIIRFLRFIKQTTAESTVEAELSWVNKRELSEPTINVDALQRLSKVVLN